MFWNKWKINFRIFEIFSFWAMVVQKFWNLQKIKYLNFVGLFPIENSPLFIFRVMGEKNSSIIGVILSMNMIVTRKIKITKIGICFFFIFSRFRIFHVNLKNYPRKKLNILNKSKCQKKMFGLFWWGALPPTENKIQGLGFFF